MRPTDYPIQHEQLHALWVNYRPNGLMWESAPPAGLDPLVWESWRRCRLHFNTGQLHPAPQDRRGRMQRWLQQYEDLIASAVPYLEDILELAHGVAWAVILTDSEARVIAVQSDPALMPQLTGLGLEVGASWDETQVGTNAVALALRSAMPVQVVGKEHYFERYHRFAVTAAPVHDDEGRMAAAIALVTPVDAADAGQLALMMATARAITNQVQSVTLLEQTHDRVRQLDAILEAVPEGVITWRADGGIEHVNSRVSEILGIPVAALLGQPLSLALNLPDPLREALERNEAHTDEEILMQVDGRTVACLVNVRPLWNGRGDGGGGVLTLRPMAQVRNLVSQQTGARASLTFDDFQSQEVRVQRLLHQAQVVARSYAPVLLVGEGGVGKNALAHAIHNASPRASGPLLVVNCRVIPVRLLLEELLGVAGDQGRPSKFELADGGTLVLDQVEVLPLEAQAALQQVIDTRHILRLYGTRATPVDVRIIATVTGDLQQRVISGAFLAQLYYRLNVVKLAIPPLRERKDDILFLAQRYLARYAADGVAPQISPAAAEVLLAYPWPGNVRELESVIERAMLHAQGADMIEVTDLPESIRSSRVLQPANPIPQPLMTIAQAEREAIVRAGHAHHGHMTKMAEALGINRSTLWRKLKAYQLDLEEFKKK